MGYVVVATIIAIFICIMYTMLSLAISVIISLILLYMWHYIIYALKRIYSAVGNLYQNNRLKFWFIVGVPMYIIVVIIIFCIYKTKLYGAYMEYLSLVANCGMLTLAIFTAFLIINQLNKANEQSKDTAEQLKEANEQSKDMKKQLEHMKNNSNRNKRIDYIQGMKAFADIEDYAVKAINENTKDYDEKYKEQIIELKKKLILELHELIIKVYDFEDDDKSDNDLKYIMDKYAVKEKLADMDYKKRKIGKTPNIDFSYPKGIDELRETHEEELKKIEQCFKKKYPLYTINIEYKEKLKEVEKKYIEEMFNLMTKK